MFCPKCGQPYTEGTRFCAHCGTPLQQEGPATHAPQPGTPPQAFSTGVACADPVMNLLRRLATSPLYLTGAIADFAHFQQLHGRGYGSVSRPASAIW